MATIKHISSKNADYGAAEEYLTYEHDEFSGKEVRDANGYLIPRKEYCMDTLLCGEDDFAIACMKANLQFGKNNRRGDVKSHHYIISYDPRDDADHGLTIEQAQKLGVAFCRKNFPGHQAIIVTHPDGHNHSGNIHTHIVINSLRIRDVPMMDYMDRACDTKAGMKHRCTSACFRYLRSEVMDMCQQNGLYQIDLLGERKDRVTEKEYRAQRRGQQKLDEKERMTAALSAESVSEAVPKAAGITATPTKFETDKEKLRKTIRDVLRISSSLEEFTEKLLQQGVTVKESRGRFSYLSADRTKPITARRLGDDFSKEAILDALARNTQQHNEKKTDSEIQMAELPVIRIAGAENEVCAARKEKPKTIKETIAERQKISRLINLDQKREEGKGVGYIHWGTVFNIHQMAGSMAYLSRNKINSMEELEAKCNETIEKRTALNEQIRDLESQIREKKELRGHIRNYWAGKNIYEEMQGIRNEKQRTAFYESHRAEIVKFEATARYFKDHGTRKLPAARNVQAEIDELYSRKNTLYQEYTTVKEKARELETVRHNIVEATKPRNRDQMKRQQERSQS